jgi:hypothetical protein
MPEPEQYWLSIRHASCQFWIGHRPRCLVVHPDVARKYGNLKETLSQAHRDDREAYTQAKGAFVGEVTQKAKRYYRTAQQADSPDALPSGAAA